MVIENKQTNKIDDAKNLVESLKKEYQDTEQTIFEIKAQIHKLCIDKEEIEAPLLAEIKKAVSFKESHIEIEEARKENFNKKSDELSKKIDEADTLLLEAKAEAVGEVTLEYVKNFLYVNNIGGYRNADIVRFKKTLKNGLNVWTAISNTDWRLQMVFKGATLVGLFGTRISEHPGDEVSPRAWLFESELTDVNHLEAHFEKDFDTEEQSPFWRTIKNSWRKGLTNATTNNFLAYASHCDVDKMVAIKLTKESLDAVDTALTC